jgi:AbrB family looped-hinge helix DNA binding protein
MPSLTRRKLIRFGKGSLVITLPKPWVDYYGLKAGDRLEVITDGKLIIRPERKAK